MARTDGTEYTRLRLGQGSLAQAAALAASAGNITQAVREALAYWHAAVAQAGRRNAEEFSPEDWTRLAALNNPDDPLPSEVRDEEARSAAWDWGQRLARDLLDQYAHRAVVLPAHVADRDACRALAARVAKLDLAQGYAMFAALRHFWRPENITSGVGGGEWWAPEVWLVPTAKEPPRE
jgi:hypothetical protein